MFSRLQASEARWGAWYPQMSPQEQQTWGHCCWLQVCQPNAHEEAGHWMLPQSFQLDLEGHSVHSLSLAYVWQHHDAPECSLVEKMVLSQFVPRK